MHVFSPWTTTGWRVTRTIALADGERKAELGLFRRVYDPDTLKHIGYQPVEKPQPAMKSSDPSSAALGVGEMHANAGLMGESFTAQLSEKDKQEGVRTGRLLVEEDFVERTEVLVREIYPHSANFAKVKVNGRMVTGDRAVRVYPRMVAR
jgi:hypothetical protein